MQKIARLALVSAAGLAMAAPAAAQTAPAGTDYSTLTSAVDWSSAITGMLAVAAVVAGVLVVRKGIKFILAAIR